MKKEELLRRFGSVWAASGMLGFFGEGYRYQEPLKRLIPGYERALRAITFAAKTATADKTTGNMPLEKDGITPQEVRPKCVKLGWWQALWGVALNAVGLSNIGIRRLLEKNEWQSRTEPFMISVTAVKREWAQRLVEMSEIAHAIRTLLKVLMVPIALQLNVSCPNTKHGTARSAFVVETLSFLDILAKLNIPIFVKINALTRVEDMAIIAQHPACAGIIVSNTLPWAEVPKWMRILFFGSTTSPLAHLGGGGLSGWPLRRRVNRWIREARKAGIKTHINAGGGIFGPLGVWSAYRAGADSISLGIISSVRPWMLWPTVAFAHWLFDC